LLDSVKIQDLTRSLIAANKFIKVCSLFSFLSLTFFFKHPFTVLDGHKDVFMDGRICLEIGYN
jgi:hypothetical protein